MRLSLHPPAAVVTDPGAGNRSAAPSRASGRRAPSSDHHPDSGDAISAWSARLLSPGNSSAAKCRSGRSGAARSAEDVRVDGGWDQLPPTVRSRGRGFITSRGSPGRQVSAAGASGYGRPGEPVLARDRSGQRGPGRGTRSAGEPAGLARFRARAARRSAIR